MISFENVVERGKFGLLKSNKSDLMETFRQAKNAGCLNRLKEELIRVISDTRSGMETEITAKDICEMAGMLSERTSSVF
jgi:hypothetical protein